MEIDFSIRAKEVKIEKELVEVNTKKIKGQTQVYTI